MWLVVQTPADAESRLSAPVDYQDYVSMQQQQKDQWCWAASGNTIAAYHGVSLSQTRFCQLAHNESGADCANLPGTLADPQRAFAKLGFASSGTYVYGRISYAAIQSQTAADQPVETRIGWNSGGGHMHVLYGYDTSKSWVYWGDPWPSNNRYNWSTYDYYAGNSSFTWTHTLTGISR
ncbi:papain-like cysteine protease family protein [Amycolatopsis sp. H20-H5]|nr:papain-like cysteine protease family protein [Amycolatopsis sp. H20-H5]MEC3982077.1 papain-like cysteine protease family protein [Amycolatopsis sp. H20-H5]